MFTNLGVTAQVNLRTRFSVNGCSFLATISNCGSRELNIFSRCGGIPALGKRLRRMRKLFLNRHRSYSVNRAKTSFTSASEAPFSFSRMRSSSCKGSLTGATGFSFSMTTNSVTSES